LEIWLYNQYNDQREVVQVGQGPITIGRDEANDVTLRSPFVSREHARIVQDNGSYFVECEGMNGLIAANREVASQGRAKIEYGDEIRIGEFSLYMMQPTQRRVHAETVEVSPRQRTIDLERRLHAELLEQLNLRVTGQMGDADARMVKMIKENLQAIISEHDDQLDDEMAAHLVDEYLWRGVVTELARRATGKLLYSYGFEDTDVLEKKKEEAISRMIGDVVSSFPLKLRPATIKDDVSTVEAGWDDQLQRLRQRISPELRQYICRRMLSKEIEDVVLGYGPLQDLLEMPNVNEIMVVGRDRIYIEKEGVLQNTGRSFFSDEIVESVIERIITPVGRRIDRSQPLVDARLPDGSRVNAVIAPLSLSGPTLTIRKFARIPFTIDDLVERATLTERSARFLRACVLGRKNIMISGGTGSGKTTTLNVLSSFIPISERIVTIEDSAELQLGQEHLVRLETRPANIEGRGAYTIRDLVRNALRMRPDRLIVGEVRGPEALDMLQAMNTGHDGSLSTIHANNPQDTMLRLETMVLMAVEMPIRAIREQIAAALHLVVQIARASDGRRRVTHISEVVGIDPTSGTIILEDVYRLRATGSEAAGQACLRHTGYIPAFVEDLIDQGVLDVEVFT
jgi:Flp pilus assembly CpaF family ATPase